MPTLAVGDWKDLSSSHSEFEYQLSVLERDLDRDLLLTVHILTLDELLSHLVLGVFSVQQSN